MKKYTVIIELFYFVYIITGITAGPLFPLFSVENVNLKNKFLIYMPKPKIKHQNPIRIKKIENDLVNFPYLNIYALYRNINIAHLCV